MDINSLIAFRVRGQMRAEVTSFRPNTGARLMLSGFFKSQADSEICSDIHIPFKGCEEASARTKFPW